MPVIVAPLAGLISTRTGTRPLLFLGMALQAVALAWIALVITPTIEYLALVPAFVLAGTEMGLCFAPIANVVLCIRGLWRPGLSVVAATTLDADSMGQKPSCGEPSDGASCARSGLVRCPPRHGPPRLRGRGGIMSVARAGASWVVAARDLYLVAMALFVVNIVIGILNGADAVEFDRNQILTHVHAGTVGWLTLTIVASAFLLFQAADRRLMLALAILVPVYVLAFYTGSLPFRALGGTALLVAIAWLLVWIWQQFLNGERSLPRLAVTLALTTFAYGAVIGVLLQLQGALAITLLSGDSVGAPTSGS